MKKAIDPLIFKKRKLYVIVSFLTVLTITLLILPATYFDEGRPMCISVLLLNKTCYGCGMTRAVQHLIHLDFKAAYEFNKLVYIVLPLLAFLILKDLRKLYIETK